MSLILERFNLGGFGIINDLAKNWSWLDLIMIFSAEWLGYLLIVYVLWWGWKKGFNIIMLTLGSAIIARYIFVELIRYFVYSPRPFAILQNINQLIAHEPTSSFPSGHVSFYFALAFGAYFLNKKTGCWSFVLAGLVGFARIYVGVHWPLDVLAGILVGWAAARITRHFMPKRLAFPRI